MSPSSWYAALPHGIQGRAQDASIARLLHESDEARSSGRRGRRLDVERRASIQGSDLLQVLQDGHVAQLAALVFAAQHIGRGGVDSPREVHIAFSGLAITFSGFA